MSAPDERRQTEGLRRVDGDSIPLLPLATAEGMTIEVERSSSISGSTQINAQGTSRPGISGSMLVKADVRLVSADEAHELIGFAASGLLLPYITRQGDPVMFGDKPFARLRLSNPTGEAKYLSPKGSGCQLYEPPGLRLLLVPGCTLGVIEGEFKALALVEAGFPCVGIGGISSACPKNIAGVPELLPALAGIIAEVRPSKIAFIGDADTALIYAFSNEAVKLAKLVSVPVVCPRIPLDAPGKGADDLRDIWRSDFILRWQAILDASEPVAAETEPAALAVRLLRRETSAFDKLDPDGLDRAHGRLVKLAYACRNDPLRLAHIETIAADFAGLAKPVLRAALSRFDEKRAKPADSVDKNEGRLIILPGGDVSITAAAEDIFARIGKTQGLFYRGGRAPRDN